MHQAQAVTLECLLGVRRFPEALLVILSKATLGNLINAYGVLGAEVVIAANLQRPRVPLGTRGRGRLSLPGDPDSLRVSKNSNSELIP